MVDRAMCAGHRQNIANAEFRFAWSDPMAARCSAIIASCRTSHCSQAHARSSSWTRHNQHPVCSDDLISRNDSAVIFNTITNHPPRVVEQEQDRAAHARCRIVTAADTVLPWTDGEHCCWSAALTVEWQTFDILQQARPLGQRQWSLGGDIKVAVYFASRVTSAAPLHGSVAS